MDDTRVDLPREADGCHTRRAGSVDGAHPKGTSLTGALRLPSAFSIGFSYRLVGNFFWTPVR